MCIKIELPQKIGYSIIKSQKNRFPAVRLRKILLKTRDFVTFRLYYNQKRSKKSSESRIKNEK